MESTKIIENKTAFDKFIDIICVPWSFIFSWTIPDAGEQSEYKKYFVMVFLMGLVWIICFVIHTV